VQSPRI